MIYQFVSKKLAYLRVLSTDVQLEEKTSIFQQLRRVARRTMCITIWGRRLNTIFSRRQGSAAADRSCIADISN